MTAQSPDPLRCYQVNANVSAPLRAAGSGFFFSVDTYFTMENVSDSTFLAGAIVTFTDLGDPVDQSTVLASTTYAAPGFTTVVNFQQVTAVNIAGDRSLSYVRASSVLPSSPGLLEDPRVVTALAGANLSSVIYVSATYRTLASQVVQQQYTYEMAQLFGDFAGTFAPRVRL